MFGGTNIEMLCVLRQLSADAKTWVGIVLLTGAGTGTYLRSIFSQSFWFSLLGVLASSPRAYSHMVWDARPG